MSDHKQKILSSKKVFQAHLFHVNELEIELSSGERMTHHVVERRPAVYIFPMTPKYELYIGREYSYNTDEFVLQIAGFIEEGENPLQAAKRELKEETGILAGQWEEFSRLSLAKSSLKAPVYLFLARDLEVSTPEQEVSEDISIMKIPLAEAVEKVMTGEISKAAVVAGILWLDKLKREKRL
ncbi:MAG TPA: NUDIX hydrolase [Candidatus Saccharimonadales bacterium]|nr:NUDIX hydrolase [Candidatus Saccharimonadales bacterium]